MSKIAKSSKISLCVCTSIACYFSFIILTSITQILRAMHISSSKIEYIISQSIKVIQGASKIASNTSGCPLADFFKNYSLTSIEQKKRKIFQPIDFFQIKEKEKISFSQNYHDYFFRIRKYFFLIFSLFFFRFCNFKTFMSKQIVFTQYLFCTPLTELAKQTIPLRFIYWARFATLTA